MFEEEEVSPEAV
jgi:hypothetical protein